MVTNPDRLKVHYGHCIPLWPFFIRWLNLDKVADKISWVYVLPLAYQTINGICFQNLWEWRQVNKIQGNVGPPVNAIGFSQGLAGFKDFSAANSWNAIDLISSKSSNNHRNYL